MVPLKADTLLRFAEPEVVFRGTITSNYLVLVSIRYMIVVKLIKPVISNPTEGQEGLRPVWRRVLRTFTGQVWFAFGPYLSQAYNEK